MAASRAHAHEAQRSQQAQVMRRGALTEAGSGGELLDGPFARQQLDEQSQPAWRAERAHGLCDLGGLEVAEGALGGVVLGGMRHPRQASDI
jgi:hypothetical protein